MYKKRCQTQATLSIMNLNIFHFYRGWEFNLSRYISYYLTLFNKVIFYKSIDATEIIKKEKQNG